MKSHEWQLVNLELSKKLKELNCKQESLWWWRPTYSLDLKTLDKMEWFLYNEKPTDKNELKYSYSAFTIAELGEMLSTGYGSFKDDLTKKYYCGSRGFLAQGKAEFLHRIANTEANARAKMLIYLIENKLMRRKR